MGADTGVSALTAATARNQNSIEIRDIYRSSSSPETPGAELCPYAQMAFVDDVIVGYTDREEGLPLAFIRTLVETHGQEEFVRSMVNVPEDVERLGGRTTAEYVLQERGSSTERKTNLLSGKNVMTFLRRFATTPNGL